MKTFSRLAGKQYQSHTQSQVHLASRNLGPEQEMDVGSGLVACQRRQSLCSGEVYRTNKAQTCLLNCKLVISVTNKHVTATVHTLSWRVLLWICVWLGTDHWSKDRVVRSSLIIFAVEEATAFQVKLDNQISVVKVFIMYVMFLSETCYIRILRVISPRSKSWFV